MSSSLSIAILFRCHNGEAPFLRGFIEHHRSLGISEFHALIFSEQSTDLAVIILEGLGVIIHLIAGHYRNFALIPVSILDVISSDYVALIDVDEFLLRKHIGLMANNNFDVYSFPWLLHVSPSIEKHSDHVKMFSLFPRGKQIVRVSSIARIQEHSCIVKPNCSILPFHETRNLPILHYYIRGFEDLLLKLIISGRHIRDRDSRLYPTAFILKSQEIGIPVIDQGLCKIDLQILRKVFRESQVTSEWISEVRTTLNLILESTIPDSLRCTKDFLDEFFDCTDEGLHLRRVAQHFYQEASKHALNFSDNPKWSNSRPSNSSRDLSQDNTVYGNLIRVVCKSSSLNSFSQPSVDDFIYVEITDKATDHFRSSLLPYAIDTRRGRLLSLQVIKEHLSMPFLYRAQREFSTVAAFTSISDIATSSERISEIRQNVTFVLSIGRCGSTLAHHILLAAGDVSFSEPDVLCQVNAFSPSLSLRIFQGLLYYFCDWSSITFPESNRVSFKLRSYQSWMYEIICSSLMNPEFIFIKRQIWSWVKSFVASFGTDYAQLAKILLLNYSAVNGLRRAGANYRILEYETLSANPGQLVNNSVIELEHIKRVNSQESMAPNAGEVELEVSAREIYEQLKANLPSCVLDFYQIL
ncbi:glycosyltransferase family 2 protein [Synechococcus sp. CCY9201]|nr:glycosyltransferase family 2 protein [Synechococcus sp. CCY9201]MEA5474120.1 glycosyltransferase family 2 protein [Synechococcus sp. CCY9201]